MRRIRLIALAAMAAAAVAAAPAPASAEPVCHPDFICVDCSSNETLLMLWRKVFGNRLECE